MRGVDGRPTLIQNAETLAHLALISRQGADWFRELGPPDDPGSTLVSLGGAVARRGVYEVECGTSLGALLDAADGPVGSTRALLVGGYGGSWLPASRAQSVALQRGPGVAPALGAGVVLALPEDGCGVCETARVAAYLAAESSGQCGPCVHGLAAIAGALGEVAAGVAEPGTHRWIERWTEDVAGRGACHHPDGAVQLVASALFTFRDEIARHEAGEVCGIEASQYLPVREPEWIGA
jgi:NADH:ubiquinone oxidoreductase subunit F (NADH-binding)